MVVKFGLISKEKLKDFLSLRSVTKSLVRRFKDKVEDTVPRPGVAQKVSKENIYASIVLAITGGYGLGSFWIEEGGGLDDGGWLGGKNGGGKHARHD